MDAHGWVILAVGFLVSFVVAYASVAWFMAWVRRRGFAPFAAYRIVMGVAVLVWARSLGH
jgi:undecaprenyl-diphosphatase